MFDELENKLPTGPGSPAASQPVGASGFAAKSEPQDIFANVESLKNSPGDLPPKPEVFLPKKPEDSLSIAGSGNLPNIDTSHKKYTMVGIIVVCVILFFGAVWYGYYILLPKLGESEAVNEEVPAAGINEEPEVGNSDNDQKNAQTPVEAPVIPPEKNAGTEMPSLAEENNKAASNSPSAENNTLDSDGDGLTDAEEISLGTDPGRSDTDDDGLFDREETKVYKTDPLVKDTDKDGFMDGAEVKSGYNPNGTGKLFDINQ